MRTVRWLLSVWTRTPTVSLFSPSQYGARAVETLTDRDILQKFQMSRWSPPPLPFRTRLVWKETSVIIIVDDPLRKKYFAFFLH